MEEIHFSRIYSSQCMAVLWSWSLGAEIILPHGAGAEITNFVSGSFLFITASKKFYISQVIKGNFQGVL
jgi:hypothetical protein